MLDYFMDKPFENQSVSAISEGFHITSLSLSSDFHDAGFLYSGVGKTQI